MTYGRVRSNISSATDRSSGFTIVELLIVIVVIGILAAVSFVAYRGISQNARAASAQASLDGIAKKLALYKVENGGYPATLADAGVTSSSGATFQYTVNNSVSPPTYCVTATVGDVSYKGTESSAPSSGGCPGHGEGGQSAITNLAANPSAEVSTTSVGCNNCTVTRDTSWSSDRSASYVVAPNSASVDSCLNLGGDVGGMRTGLQAGKTYSVSATIRLAAPLTGTLDGRSLRIAAYYKTPTGSYVRVESAPAPNAAGEYRLSVTYAIPSDANEAFIRLYSGASSGNGLVWWDAIMLTEGSTIYNFADGDSTDWVWNGTANNSTSTGPAP